MTADQSRALDCLALGLSINATGRETGIPDSTIGFWVNGASFAEQFRAELEVRKQLFRDNLAAVEMQMAVQSTALVAQAIAGELERDYPDADENHRGKGQNPLRYEAAVEFLRSTRWKQLAGEEHKRFGS